MPCQTSWLLLQTIEIFVKKNCEGVSLPAFLLVFIGGIVWLVYGFFVLKPRDKAVGVVTSSCGDEKDQEENDCEYWQNNGHCTGEYATYMNNNCARTCCEAKKNETKK